MNLFHLGDKCAVKEIPIGIKAEGERTETDSMGAIAVPANRYWGAQTIIINNFLHSAHILGDGCGKFRKYSVEGTQINIQKILQYVKESVMMVTALAPPSATTRRQRLLT